jgi:uncharacterized protein
MASLLDRLLGRSNDGDRKRNGASAAPASAVREQMEGRNDMAAPATKKSGGQTATPMCCVCGKGFLWTESYQTQDTPGSAAANPPERPGGLHTSTWRPRAYCPHCGSLVAEWHVDSECDYDEWIWFGDNATLNASAPLPDFPGGIPLHCREIPAQLLPELRQHQLDVVKVREHANNSRTKPGVTGEQWFSAVPHGDPEEVRNLIDQGVDVDRRDWEGQTALHRTISPEIARLLLKSGASVQARDKEGATPLHKAAWRGREEIVSILIEAGADVNARGNYDLTPLHWAARTGRSGVAKILIDAGADVNAQIAAGLGAKTTGTTPLFWAINEGFTHTATFLRDRGAE